MQIGKYLQKNQPIIYQTFVNSMKKGELSHAYLLVGDIGTPLFNVAQYLAKSLLCDAPSPLACDSCINCLRIDDNNYPDLLVFDGSKGNIKKEEILSIQSKFDKKALETKGIMIYVIHLIENMTSEAINSMLKFLEEPQENVYAILTTNNESNVLPTIISRCQTLHLKPKRRETVIKEAIELNVNQSNSEWLSYFYNDGELIFELCNNEDEFKVFAKNKEMVELLLNSLLKDDKKEIVFDFQKEILPNIKNKQSGWYFIDMLVQIYEDLINIQNEKDFYLKSYDTILKALAEKLTNVNQVLIELLKLRNILNLNVNISLMLDHLILSLIKE